MADLLFDFETYFKTHNALNELYKDYMPDKPDEVTVVQEYQGSSPIAQIASVDRSLQFVVRSKSAATAKTKAKELYKLLQTDDGILNLTPERWCMIFLRQTPFKIKVDDSNRVVYGFNVGVTTYY